MSRKQKNKGRPEETNVAIFNRKDWILGLILVGAVIVAYLPIWHAGFIWDDDFYVTNNKLLSASGGLWRIWFTAHTQSQYFPLVFTTLRFECELWGLNPLGYHLVNVCLHIANALLIWTLLKRLALPGAWFAAAIFALHPVQVETVAWVTELKNTESTLFYLLAIFAWLNFCAGRGWRFYALAFVLYVLALFAKTTACTLPAVMLLLLWLKGEPVDRKRFFQTLPFLMAGVAMGLLSVWWEKHLGNYQPQHRLLGGPLDRVLIAAHALWFYAAKFFWPVNLTFSYPRWKIDISDWRPYFWLAGCLVVAAALWLNRHRIGRRPIAAILFFAAVLSPMLDFFPTYTFYYSYLADHYQYFACLGLTVLFVGMAIWLSQRFQINLCMQRGLATMLLLVLGILTWRQCDTYVDAETLWRTTIQRNPDSWMARLNLGNLLVTKGKTDEAIGQFQRALQINTNDADIYYDLGNALLQKGDADEAITYFRQALQIEPDYVEAHNNFGNALLQKRKPDEAITQFQKALQSQPEYAEACVGLGNALLQEQKTDEAIAQFRKALQIDPDSAEACYDLGNVLLQKGNLDEAIAYYQQAVKINPSHAEAQNNLGEALLQKGNVDEAIAHFNQALQIKPDYAAGQFNLGLALSHKGDLYGAITCYQKALEINPDYLEAQVNLGNALRQTGDVKEAIVHYQKALELSQAAGRQDFVERLNAELRSLSKK